VVFDAIRSMGKRLDDQQRRAAEVREKLDRRLSTQADRLTEQGKQLQAMKKTLAAVQAQVRPYERAASLTELDYRRTSLQVGGLEERVGRLEQRIADGELTSDDASVAEARSLIEAVRREHDQARVRLQIISSYEERLRRVEASVVALYDGDVRHPV
jgi:anti-sigma28 factor (negative regulator of flagellin synthesis)